MRKELAHIEEIENYLMGRLTDIDKANFETKLASDSKLRSEVHFQRDFVEGLQRAGLKSDTQSAYRKFKLRKLLMKLGIGIISTGLLVGAYYFIQNNLGNEITYCVCNEGGISSDAEQSENVDSTMRSSEMGNCLDTCQYFTGPVINEVELINTDTTYLYEEQVDSIVDDFIETSPEEKIVTLDISTTNDVKSEFETTVIKVEVEPSYPGGFTALSDFISDNIKYPQKAIDERISGTVYIKFTVNQKGQIVDPTIEKGVSKEIDAEALRVVKKMPNWNPAEYQGEMVPSYFTLPINFFMEH